MKSLMQEMVELLKKVEDVEQAATMLVEKAYDKGFDNGVSHAKLGMVAEKVETDQEKRDRLVKQAKEFVEKTEANYGGFNFKYVINRVKRTVVVLAYGKRSGRLYVKGIARCMRDDCFNEHIGKAIALHRALGLEVPQEYLDVPNPTEVRIGNKILNNDGLVRKVVGSNDLIIFDIEKDVEKLTCQLGSFFAKTDVTKIIDDTESEPNV